MATHTDPYRILGVSPGATESEIKSAWRKKSRETHPDTGGDAVLFQQVQVAYKQIKDGNVQAHGYTSTRNTTTKSNTQTGGTWQPQSTTRPKPTAQQTQRVKPTMAVDPAKVAWAKNTAPDPEVTVTPKQRNWMRHTPYILAAIGFLLAWSSVTVAPAGSAFAGKELLSLLLTMIAAVSIYRKETWWAGAALAVALPVSGLFDPLGTNAKATGFLLALSLICSAAASGIKGYRVYTNAAAVDAVMGEEKARKYNTYGRPGTPGTINNADTRMAARMGDDAVALLTWFPAVRCFHAPPYAPGTKATSHLVVCGNKVAVIDTTLWHPGMYDFSPHGAVLHNRIHFPYGESQIHDAVTSWRNKLSKNYEVRGWVMLGSPHGPVSIGEHVSYGASRLGTPQQVVDEVGLWFASGDVNTVDRGLLYTIAKQFSNAAHA